MNDKILDQFFEQFGIIGNIDQIYINSIYTILSQYFDNVKLLSPQDEIYCIKKNIDYEEYCMTEKKSYEWEIYFDNRNSFRIPRMVNRKGYFIIDGVIKNPLIQELKSRYSVFTSLENEKNNEKIVYVETRFLESTIPFKIIYDNKSIKIDLSILQKDLKQNKINEISTISLQTLIYKMMKISVSELRSIFSLPTFGIWNHFIVTLDENEEDSMDTFNYDMIYNLINTKCFGSYFNKKQILLTLSYLLKKAIDVYEGVEECSDRDDYEYKILQSGGIVIGSLLKICLDEYYNKDIDDKRTDVEIETDSTTSKLYKKSKTKHIQQIIFDKIYSVFKLGYYVINGRKYDKMIIDTSQRNIIDMIASVRKIVIPVDENSSNLKMRDIHDSQKRYVDPIETPESKKAGLIKYLSSTTIISEYIDPINIITFLSHWVDMELKDKLNTRFVIFNGCIIGQLKNLNEDDHISYIKYLLPQLSIVMNEYFVFIRSFEGRPLRPVLVVSDIKKQDSWNEYIESSQIQYFDPIEIKFAKQQNKYFQEITEENLLGITSNLIPFITHNQGARGIFATSQLKQALPLNSDFLNKLEDKKSIYYSQTPLVNTYLGHNIGSIYSEDKESHYGFGINCIVLRATIPGLNDEDAIIVNKASAERGLFMNRSTHSEKIIYKGNTIILNSLSETIISDDMTNQPITTNTGAHVYDSRNNIIYSTSHINSDIEKGDKLTNRHGQKGVVSRFFSPEDLPVSKEGIIPDLIVNPIGRFARMTMGEILEGIFGRECAENGEIKIINNFTDRNLYEFKLEDKKYHDVIYDGRTGQRIQFSGKCCFESIYFMALKHQTRDKQYYRNMGSINPITGQPPKGKKRGGGVRHGEQEMASMVAYASSNNLNEVSDRSDRGSIKICMSCPISDFCIEEDRCKKCLNLVQTIPINYAVISFIRFLQTIGIHLNLKDTEHLHLSI